MTAASTVNRGAGDYGRKTSDDMADKAANLADKAGEQLDRVVQNVETAARTMAEQGRQAGEQVQVVADNFKTAVDKSVKDQPLTTLAVTAAVGFIIGALWKS
jgi:ElaB/YqjD/DUF883 family membrane-anchored ribosome-binding protein